MTPTRWNQIKRAVQGSPHGPDLDDVIAHVDRLHAERDLIADAVAQLAGDSDLRTAGIGTIERAVVAADVELQRLRAAAGRVEDGRR